MTRVSKKELERRERLKALAGVADDIKSFDQGRQVLTPVRSAQTIFPQFDVATRVNGYPIQRVCLVHGPSNEGKAQPVSERVLTPDGWRPIGQLTRGDYVVGSNGAPTKITGVYPQGVKEVFRVVTRDGTTRCCDEHLWFTTTDRELNRGRYVRGPRPDRARVPTGKDGEGSVKSLAEIRETLGDGHYLPRLSGPVQFVARGAGPLDPYVLGLLLGDGSFLYGRVTFSSNDAECRDAVHQAATQLGDLCTSIDACEDRAAQISVVSTHERGKGQKTEMRKCIESLGLAECGPESKFVPKMYLAGSPDERLALLRGLCDSDGHVTATGTLVEFVSVSETLAKDVAFLIRSLGGYAKVTRKEPYYVSDGCKVYGKPAWRVKFWTPQVPVQLPRKVAMWSVERKDYRNRVEQVVPAGREECVCIAVEAEDRLYVTEDFILTHNTFFMLGLGKSFLMGEHFYFHIDAEFTTPEPWVVENLRAFADYPTFQALRPRNYEEVADSIREACERITTARDRGHIPQHTSALFGVDSLQKLIPKDFLKKLADKKKGGGVDPMSGRGGQVQAAFNAAWMKELVPLMYHANAAIVLISRESENVDATGMFDKAYKVGGGKAPYYDSSLVVRCTRNGWVKVGSGDNERIIGERHLLQIVKTKVGHKDDKTTRCFFHTSNGELIPAGFDMARDVIELGLRAGTLQKDKAHNIIDAATGEVYGVTNAAVQQLTADHRTLGELRDRTIMAAEPDEEVA